MAEVSPAQQAPVAAHRAKAGASGHAKGIEKKEAVKSKAGSGRIWRGVLIGCGNVACRAHIPAWRRDPRFRIAALLEPDPARRQLARELLPEAAIYSAAGPWLADGGFDFADICAPPAAHAELALAALRAGLHVLCEKPLVTSYADLARLREAACQTGRTICTVHNWRYAPLFRAAAALVRSGCLGAIHTVSLTVLRPPTAGGGVSAWRQRPEIAGGGILLDHGWHQLYLLRTLLPTAPLTLSAHIGRQGAAAALGVEDIVRLEITYPAATAVVELSWRADRRRNEGLVTGERGELRLEDDHLVLRIGSRQQRQDFPEALSAGSHHADWMEGVITEFHEEMEDPVRCGTNLTEATWCAYLINLAYRSHREGSALPVVAPL